MGGGDWVKSGHLGAEAHSRSIAEVVALLLWKQLDGGREARYCQARQPAGTMHRPELSEY